MSDPRNALQIVQRAALVADAGVIAAMGGTARVFDRVPDQITYPHVRIGEAELNDDSNSCAAAYEIFSTVHIFSRSAAGRAEVQEIDAAIRAVLVDESLAPAGYQVTLARFRSSRSYQEKGDVTWHGVLQVHYLIDPTA